MKLFVEEVFGEDLGGVEGEIYNHTKEKELERNYYIQ